MNLRIEPLDTLLLVVDYQERLAAAMPAGPLEAAIKNTTHLLTLADRLGLPVVATEQYPRGLGPTVGPIATRLAQPAHPKTMFSVWADRGARVAIEATQRRTVVLCGMETHVCVFQTARDLVAAGYTVHVPSDAVVSRAKGNWRAGLKLIVQSGAAVTCTESVLFDVLKEGRGEAFKEVSRLIR